VEVIVIKVLAVVVAVVAWLAAIWLFERGARKKVAMSKASPQPEPGEVPEPSELRVPVK
jgi:hypothetical protein